MEQVRYCQQHRESVNTKTFDLSEHGTRIWYHGTAASKTCLQAPPPFPHPQVTTQLASLANIFLFDSVLWLSPHCRAWYQAKKCHKIYLGGLFGIFCFTSS